MNVGCSVQVSLLLKIIIWDHITSTFKDRKADGCLKEMIINTSFTVLQHNTNFTRLCMGNLPQVIILLQTHLQWYYLTRMKSFCSILKDNTVCLLSCLCLSKYGMHVHISDEVHISDKVHISDEKFNKASNYKNGKMFGGQAKLLS